ncbi:hypothetical protein GGD67_002921 [Bradyrhizobium sp. IAR9]|nr:hypothetical protein [Bradyrhizobium sp. IAR9]
MPWPHTASRKSQRDAKHRRDNRDQDSQFISAAFTGALPPGAGVRISNGRTWALDGLRLHRTCLRSLKHEGIYLKRYADGREAKGGSPAGSPSTTSIAFIRRSAPHADRRLARGNRERPCGHDGQRRRAHMPTAATTADDSPCDMIVGEGAVGFQTETGSRGPTMRVHFNRWSSCVRCGAPTLDDRRLIHLDYVTFNSSQSIALLQVVQIRKAVQVPVPN